ncbi:hypothetical protein AB0N38_33095 [Micromonospora aurantiaca]|uniref:phage tail tube protein n=1 Tax=Micromonospora aurantiaca (nom. illeg.) TaxID=47850 RepID=UPI0034190D58
MTLRRVNARDLIFEVSDMATPGPPVWAGIGGMTEAEVDPSANEETEDTTDFDSEGNYSQEVMQRGASLKLTGRILMDDVTGVRDPGQVLVNLHATKVGPDSQVDVRFRYPWETSWSLWTATVTRGAEGGGTNNKTGLEYTFTRCGAPESAAVV